MAPALKTAPTPAPIPKLADHPGYAAALARRAAVAALADPIHDELREIDAALAAMRTAEAIARERKVSDRPGPRPAEVAAEALLAGVDRPRTAGRSRSELLARREHLEFEADVVATALRKFDAAEAYPGQEGGPRRPHAGRRPRPLAAGRPPGRPRLRRPGESQGGPPGAARGVGGGRVRRGRAVRRPAALRPPARPPGRPERGDGPTRPATHRGRVRDRRRARPGRRPAELEAADTALTLAAGGIPGGPFGPH